MLSETTAFKSRLASINNLLPRCTRLAAAKVFGNQNRWSLTRIAFTSWTERGGARRGAAAGQDGTAGRGGEGRSKGRSKARRGGAESCAQGMTSRFDLQDNEDKCPGRHFGSTNKGIPDVIEHKRCPTGKISQHKTRVKTDRFRMQTLHTPQRRAGCAPLDASSTRLLTRRVHVAGRAGCAPEDALVCASGDAPVCASGDAPVCASGDAPGKRAGCARRCARSKRVCARGARVPGRARSTRVGARVAGRRIRPFFSVGFSRSEAVVWVRGSGPVPRAAACQPLATGGAGRPPLR